MCRGHWVECGRAGAWKGVEGPQVKLVGDGVGGGGQGTDSRSPQSYKYSAAEASCRLLLDTPLHSILAM